MWTKRATRLNHPMGGAHDVALDAYEARGGLGRPQAAASQLWRRGRDISGRYVRFVSRVTYLVLVRTRHPIYGHAVWHKVRI